MLLEEQLPRIQKLIKEKLGTLPTDALQNEVVMRTAFRRLYQALPRMIRLAVGEQGFVERVSFWSDPAFVDSETAPFNSVGQPLSRQSWVENGRLVNLACSRFWALWLGVEALPGSSNFIMQGGDNSLEEMIASTKKGVLLTRFWYIRGLNPRIISYTGLSRDGTFLIEDGKIARPVTNFRFNQSLVSMLENVEMVGPAVRVAASENSSVNTAIVVPPVKASGFNLSSVSDAI